MVVDVVCVQVGGDHDLIVIAPHAPCGFHADGVCFFRCHLTGLKALVSVISHIAAQLSIAPLGVHHGFVGQLLGTVDGTDKGDGQSSQLFTEFLLHFDFLFGIIIEQVFYKQM